MHCVVEEYVIINVWATEHIQNTLTHYRHCT